MARYVAYSSWQSTFANPSIPVGLFIYEKARKNTQQVYMPKENESIELRYWEGINKVIFTKDGQGVLYNYDMHTKNSDQLCKILK